MADVEDASSLDENPSPSKTPRKRHMPSTPQSSAKKKRYAQKFKSSYKETWKFISEHFEYDSKGKKFQDMERADCNLCKRAGMPKYSFKIACGGANDITRHIRTDLHQRAIKCVSGQQDVIDDGTKQRLKAELKAIR